MTWVRRWWPLGLLLAAAAALYAFSARHVLGFDTLRSTQAWLERMGTDHPATTALAFVAATTVYLLLSLPAEGLLTAVGGMLFGIVLGTVLSVAGTVLSALILFFGLRAVLGRQLEMPHGPRIERIRRRMEGDGANYLLVLRLLPVLPFGLISLLAVLVRMRALPYVLATAAGVIPPTAVFASAGTGLGDLLARGGHLHLSSFLSGRIQWLLVGLAALALLPVAHRAWRNHAARSRPAADDRPERHSAFPASSSTSRNDGLWKPSVIELLRNCRR